MIKLLLRKKYYELLKRINFKKYNIFNNIEINNYPSMLLDNSNNGLIYYEVSGNLFVYISEFKEVLIPDIYNEDEVINLIKNSSFTLENWRISYYGLKDKKKYLLNTFKQEYNTISIKCDDGNKELFIKGDYKIENSDYPKDEKISFSVSDNMNELNFIYFPENYIAFPEKELVDVPKRDKIELSNFIILTLNEYRSYYQRSN